LTKRIDFYFDYLSPYSFLAWEILEKQHNFFSDNCQFHFYPVVLSKIIHHYETKGPGEILPKREYLLKDCLRLARKEEIPFIGPPKLPFNSLMALRLSLVENHQNNLRQKSLISQIFQHTWGAGGDISSPEELTQLLERWQSTPDESTRLLASESSKESRIALRENISRAHSFGVFGVPTFVVDEKELFWGCDSLENLKRYINNDDLLDEKKYQFFLQKFT
jgi:2-hydroxychromene-2-carboxylate isomerase